MGSQFGSRPGFCARLNRASVAGMIACLRLDGRRSRRHGDLFRVCNQRVGDGSAIGGLPQRGLFFLRASCRMQGQVVCRSAQARNYQQSDQHALHPKRTHVRREQRLLTRSSPGRIGGRDCPWKIPVTPNCMRKFEDRRLKTARESINPLQVVQKIFEARRRLNVFQPKGQDRQTLSVCELNFARDLFRVLRVR